MCAFTAFKTQAVGDALVASDWNTYIRDNGNEMCVAKSTAQGDLVYATAANTLARLGIGSAGQVLMVNASTTAPAWSAGKPASGYFMGANGANYHVESGTSTTNSTGMGGGTFTNAFASAPTVVAVGTGQYNTVFVSSISASTFAVQAFDGASGQATSIYWMALGAD